MHQDKVSAEQCPRIDQICAAQITAPWSRISTPENAAASPLAYKQTSGPTHRTQRLRQEGERPSQAQSRVCPARRVASRRRPPSGREHKGDTTTGAERGGKTSLVKSARNTETQIPHGILHREASNRLLASASVSPSKGGASRSVECGSWTFSCRGRPISALP